MKVLCRGRADKHKYLHILYRFCISYSNTANDIFDYLRTEIFAKIFSIKVLARKLKLFYCILLE